MRRLPEEIFRLRAHRRRSRERSSIVNYNQNFNNDSVWYSFGPFLESQLTPHIHVSLEGGYQGGSFDSGGLNGDTSNLDSFYVRFQIAHRVNRYIMENFDIGRGPTSGLEGQSIRSRSENYGLTSGVENTTSMEVLDDKRPLRVGDRLSMRVVEDRKPPMPLVVTDSGEVEVPLVGRVMAKGKTCKQLAYSIKGPLERDYYYKATVIIGLDVEGHVSPGRVYVTGQVQLAGPNRNTTR
jgi:Polysaccharide biosynthesis/export protein